MDTATVRRSRLHCKVQPSIFVVGGNAPVALPVRKDVERIFQSSDFPFSFLCSLLPCLLALDTHGMEALECLHCGIEKTCCLAQLVLLFIDFFRKRSDFENIHIISLLGLCCDILFTVLLEIFCLSD